MSQFSGLNDPQLENVLSAEGVERLHEEAELAQIGYAEFDAAAYRHGDMPPAYFGPALHQFGISELIAALAKHAPPTRPQPAEPVPVSPDPNDGPGCLCTVQARITPPNPDLISLMHLF